jgi:autotransporter-associated beta strand protein
MRSDRRKRAKANMAGRFTLLDRVIRVILAAIVLPIFPVAARAYDLHFDYTSFDNPGTPGANPHFGQAQFDVLNYPSMNGNYMMTSTDNHRPEMVASGNNLAEFYNNFLADYNKNPRPTAIQEADAIHAYTTSNSTRNGPRPSWLILNEISSSLWQQNPGAPSLNAHRQWVIDCVTRLHDVYDYNVVTYSPYGTLGTTLNGPSWRALAEKSYIGIERYLSGPEVLAGGADYASRLAWAHRQYQTSKTTYMDAGVPAGRLFLGEHFANNTAGNGWGRAGISSADWDAVIQIRQDAVFNVGFAGFLAYSWGGNGMGISEAEQIQHEYYYRSRRVLPTQQPQWLPDNAININGTLIPLSWNEPLNWVGGVPDAAGAVANFWRTNTASRTVTLDGDKTVGTLTFASAHNYAISPGTGGSLLFDKSGGRATLTSNEGNHSLDVDIQLGSHLSAAINAGTFTISGIVSGHGELAKSGEGTFALIGANSYTGNTVVQAGTLRFHQPSLTSTSDVFLTTGGVLNLNFTGSPNVIDLLFIDGVSQPAGIWGAVGSDAAFDSPLITGAGRLHVSRFIAPPLAGDFNADGVVNAADYIVWRNGLDTTYTQADYDVWRANFGRTAGGVTPTGAAAAAPEPLSLVLLVLAVPFVKRNRSVKRRRVPRHL